MTNNTDIGKSWNYIKKSTIPNSGWGSLPVKIIKKGTS